MFEYFSILKQACDGLFETQPKIKKEIIESVQTQEKLNVYPETNSVVDKRDDNFIDGLFNNKDNDILLEDSTDISNDSLDNSAIGK